MRKIIDKSKTHKNSKSLMVLYEFENNDNKFLGASIIFLSPIYIYIYIYKVGDHSRV